MQISEIKGQFQTRKINDQYVEFLVKDFTENGFKNAYPVSIDKDGLLWDGNHRLAAAKKMGMTEIPHIIETPDNMRFEAHERNRVAANNLPETFVDHAEEIWAMLAEGKTQQKVADDMKWSLGNVKKYSALQSINSEVWKELIVPTFQGIGTFNDGNNGTDKVPTGTITEGLLRDILCLTPDHQYDLVSDLVSGDITKAKFKNLAVLYKARDEAAEYVWSRLRTLDESFLITALKEIDNGKYDNEWVKKANGKAKSVSTTEEPPTYPNTDKLIQAQVDAYEEKNSIQLIHGDFYQKVKDILPGTIDLIITDPPYNIAHTHNRPYEGRKDRSSDFGEWDKHEHDDFKACFSDWFEEFSRIMATDSSGYLFTSDVYISHISEALQLHGFTHRSTITWHKTNPGTSQMKDNFISSNEYIVFFKRGKPVFNFTDDNEMQNFIQSPVCAGNERVKDSKQNVLHPTQKPERVIRQLMEVSSNRGQKVFDGFMGVGTTARVAKSLGRKFIGIEMDDKFFKAIEV